jgi:hypothetical protein
MWKENLSTQAMGLEPMTGGDVSRNIPSFLFAEGSRGKVLSKPNQDVEEKL